MDKPLRVAIVANYPSHYSVDLFNRLAESPHLAVRVFYLRRGTPGRQWKELRQITHDYTFVPEWRLHRTFYLNPGLMSRVLSYHPDQLIVTQYASIGMQVLIYVFTLLRRPWIFWSESPGVQFSEMPAVRVESLRRILRPIALFPVRRWASQVWGVGRSTTARFARMCRAPCANIPYTFDQSAFQAIERAHGPGESVRLLFSGKLVYRKGLGLLLAALQELAETRSDFSLTILGSGPEEQLVARLPQALRDKIELLGFREVREIPAIYAACDVLVFPSRYDGWGIAVIEAMAAAMPVVASRAAVAAVDAIDDGVTGYLFDSDSVPSLVQSLQRLLAAKDQIRAMGAAARRTASRFDARVGAQQMASLLRTGGHLHG